MTTTNDAPAPAPSGSGVREALRELIDRVHDFGTFAIDADDPIIAWDNSVVPALVAARASLASDASSRGEADMRRVCEALGFDPTNHHNAAKCPYCTPEHPAPATVEMREALEPFSKIYSESIRDWPAGFSPHRDDKRHAWGFNGADLTWGDFRRAHELLAALAPATEGRKG